MAMVLDNESPRRSKLVELLGPGKYYPVLEVLSSYLTIGDSLALRQVCKGLDGLQDHMLMKISNINMRLRDFVDDPAMFRSQLGSYGALISGTFALNVLELGHRKALYLDVFIEDGIGADEFTKYIQESEKYQNDNPEVGRTRNRRVYGNNARPGIKLRITRTSGPPIQRILTSSHTTACINFITWNKAYSIFPRQTLIDHQFHPLRLVDDAFGSTLTELSHQGWTTRDIIWPDFPKAPTIDGLRRVGDGSTLVIPLDTTSVQVPSTPDFVIEHAQFSIAQRQPPQMPLRDQFGQALSQNPAPFYSALQIHARKLTSHAIRYGYTTSSQQWESYVTQRLLRWAWLEFYKLGRQSRPFQHTDLFPLVSDLPFSERFKKPVTWDYADDQIPQWYREWEQQVGKGGR